MQNCFLFVKIKRFFRMKARSPLLPEPLRGPGQASGQVSCHTRRDVLPGANSTVNRLLRLQLHTRR